MTRDSLPGMPAVLQRPAPFTTDQRIKSIAEIVAAYAGVSAKSNAVSGSTMAVPLPKRRLSHARSLPNVKIEDDTEAYGAGASAPPPSSAPSRPTLAMRSVSAMSAPRGSRSPRNNLELAHYLRSPRLTRLILTRRPPHAGLTVSLADVGAEDGHPVIVFLGLGCIRYLVAMYDELAESLGLRLICIDRWGLGKTSDVSDENRGFCEWASIVEEVADVLRLDTFSIIAHSAGAPYALATASRLPCRVHGCIHLLAPWVATGRPGDTAAAYNWLRWIPNGIIRSAQAADCRMQGWRLGKPPKAPAEKGIGYDSRAPVSSVSYQVPAPQSPESRDVICSPLSRSHNRKLSDLLRRCSSSPRSTTPTESLSPALDRPCDSPAPSVSPTPSDHSRESRQTKPGRGTPSPFRSALSPFRLSRPPCIASDERPCLDLGSALLAASYAESLKGASADLFAILERTSKPMGFSYASVTTPVKAWHGDRDDRISLASVRSLEEIMPNATVNIVKGAGHDLMSEVHVVNEVLHSIASEWT